MGLFSKKPDLFDVCYGKNARDADAARAPKRLAPAARSVEVVPVSALGSAPVRMGAHDGDKFAGGFGATNLLYIDYWTLRARSAELYQRNLYARGLIRRMVTNEINVGLHLEATPEESLLGMPQDSLSDWSELVETRFSIWANDPLLCDHAEQNTFGEIQANIRREALVVGDVLVVRRQDQRTGLPRIQLLNGSRVQTPAQHWFTPHGANRVVHGVELDPSGKHVAYWVRQDDGSAKRLPAWGEKTGRRIAWLVYGTDKREDEVRGQPLLSLVLQSVKEIDRYRDSVQRKATINSMLALFIKKTQDKAGTRPIASGGISRRLDTAVDNAGEERSFHVTDYNPGVVLDELQQGEEPHGFSSNGTDEKFGDFERAIVSGFAWGHEMPPEILMLSFNSNYSASQAAINEYKLYLNPVRTSFGKAVCTPIYHEFLVSEVLDGRIQAAGLLEAWRDPKQYDTLGAWLACDWAGNIKPAVDLSKLVAGYAAMVKEGFISRDRATREITGMKHSKVVQRLVIENAQLAKANLPMAELEAASKAAPAPPGGTKTEGPEQVNREDDDKERALLRVAT